MIELPTIYTASFFAKKVMGDEAVVSVGMSPVHPRDLGVALHYELEEQAITLTPGLLHGEWSDLSPEYLRYLGRQGLEAVSGELTAISRHHGGAPLAIRDWEDVTRPGMSLRSVFAHWWREQTGQEVLELLDDGTRLRVEDLPKQNWPKPAVKPGDKRIASAEHTTGWPLGDEDFRLWVASRHWQEARSANKHAYTVRSWGDELMFFRAVLHAREHGEPETYAREQYLQYRPGDGYKYWSMSHPVASTFILNRKELPEEEMESELAVPRLLEREEGA